MHTGTRAGYQVLYMYTLFYLCFFLIKFMNLILFVQYMNVCLLHLFVHECEGIHRLSNVHPA